MKNPAKLSLTLSTVCVGIILLTHIIDYIETGDPGGIISNICFIAAGICMVIAWIAFFLDKKHRS